MKAAKRASGWYCQFPPDVHTHIYPPHILAPSTRSVELSLYFRCIGTTLVWPLSVYLHAHRLTDDLSHQLIVHFHPLAKPCEFTILPLSCPLSLSHTHTQSLSLFLVFLRMQTHEHTLFLPLITLPPLSFFLDPTVRFGVTVHLHHAAFPQLLYTGGLHFTQENSLWLAQLWMLAIIPHKHKVRLLEKGGVACMHACMLICVCECQGHRN